MTTSTPTSPPPETPHETSFAETALTLGGKSEEEARRTGAIDRADDQVEQLFKAQYQTVNSPIHRAVWERTLPVELFEAADASTPPDVQQVMSHSLDVVRRMTHHLLNIGRSAGVGRLEQFNWQRPFPNGAVNWAIDGLILGLEKLLD